MTVEQSQDALRIAYAEAEAADLRYQLALNAQYGSEACEMRYHPSRQSPAILALHDAYLTACDVWQEACRTMRALGGSLNA